MNRYLAEAVGTAVLVLFGCGAAVMAARNGLAPDLSGVGLLGIAFAFGLSIVAMAYGIGPVSGCHINPAVTIGQWVAGRVPTAQVPGYIIAQIIGALIGAAILALVVSDRAGGYEIAKAGLGQNGWGAGYLGQYGTLAAFVVETVATFVFLVVILGVTGPGGQPALAGLAIGLTLVLIHIVFIPVTGVSVNPARSIGPALFVGGTALAQLWLFIVAPLLGAVLAGLAFRAKLIGE